MTEDEVAAFVDDIKLNPTRRDELVALLPEDAAIYAGRGTNAAIRLKGYALAAFEAVGTPRAALPFILDELQNGRDAYVTAAAAKAVRGLDDVSSELAQFLLTAIDNIRYCDDALTFDTFKPHWPVEHRTTALEEIVATLAWLGPAARPVLAELEPLVGDATLSDAVRLGLEGAIQVIRASAPAVAQEDDCCCGPTIMQPSVQAERPADPALEDQDGRRMAYGEFFSGAPSIVVFFYTRCDNPNKCSLTIAKLAQLQQSIAAAGLSDRLKTAAFTYDPGFDLPVRLRAYGENRNVIFDANNRFFRTPDTFEDIRNYFQLGVNYGDVLVNRHRIELYLLDASGAVVESITRLQWDPDDVQTRAQRLLA